MEEQRKPAHGLTEEQIKEMDSATSASIERAKLAQAEADMLRKNMLIKEIAEKNEKLKALEEEVKALKVLAQDEFPVGTTVIVDAVITIKEIARTNFDTKSFQKDFEALYKQYCSVFTYKTVSCSVQG